jgi:serine protease Do
MSMLKFAALAGALAAAAGTGAAFTPVAHGQTTTVRAPQAIQIVDGWGGSQIGVAIEDVDPGDTQGGQTGGIVIKDVTEDSPAEQAGLKAGDIIVEFDGERVRSARQFTRLVQETVPGRKVQAAVMRGGQRTTVTVEPRERGGRLFNNLNDYRELEEFAMKRPPAPPPTPRQPSRPSERAFPMIPDFEGFMFGGGNTLGLTAGELSPQLAEYFGTKEGVLVTSVRDDSAAAKAGLKAGDVVTSVNGTDVERPADLRREIQRLRAGDEFTLNVVRDKKATTVKGKVEESSTRRRTFRSIV